jgi:hypothetical protein
MLTSFPQLINFFSLLLRIDPAMTLVNKHASHV